MAAPKKTPVAAPAVVAKPVAVAKPASVAAVAKVEAPKVAPAPKAVPAPKAAAAKPAAAELLKPFETFQEQVRATTEKNLAQFRDQYSALKDNAETATDKLEEGLAAAQAGTRNFGLKMFDLFRTQTTANLAHVQSLLAAKSIEDAVKLQQTYVGAQIEQLQAQSKEFAALAQKVATDVAEPVKASMVVAFKR